MRQRREWPWQFDGGDQDVFSIGRGSKWKVDDISVQHVFFNDFDINIGAWFGREKFGWEDVFIDFIEFVTAINEKTRFEYGSGTETGVNLIETSFSSDIIC